MLELDVSQPVIDAVAAATTIDAMRDAAGQLVPEGGKGFWVDEAAFFHSGGTEKWAGKLSEADLALYDERMSVALKDAAARRWLEFGQGHL